MKNQIARRSTPLSSVLPRPASSLVQSALRRLPDVLMLAMRCENAWTPGEDTSGADMYQLYRTADRTSSPAPLIAQAGTLALWA